ncbi:MAG: serine/threonine protein kinase [Planctomycetaceae bacterium]|nr:serine/threonine protein kinase [Planctomycetaceae bacterium]
MRERLRRGEHPRPQEYETRFPGDRDTVLGLDWTTLASPEEVARATADFSTLVLPATSRRERVGRFELLDRLGIGGFGEVWRAFDPHLQREVALKIGHFSGGDKARAALLLHEAKSARRLRHAGIVPIHDAGIDGERAYIVSELVRGTNLAERLKAGAFPVRRAADLVRKVAEAVAHAHDRGIIHRDIKPANVLLDSDDEPRLTDFGIARRAAGDQTISHVGQALGTPAYMAPEQASGDVAAVDHRSDVYSLGVLLYETLAGRRAFPGDAREALKRVLSGPPERLRLLCKDLPRDLETIVETAMARERGARYQTAAELAKDLDRYLAGEPIVARRASVPERAWRFVRRHPLYFTTPLLVVAALVGREAFWTVGHKDDTKANASLPGFLSGDQALESPLWFPGEEDRPVEIATDPPGAKVWLFPIDRRNGWPRTDASARIDAAGKSPTRVEVPPGEYLVVGDLGGGRFNEVHRWVPRRSEGMSINAAPVSWKTLPDRAIGVSFKIPEPPENLVKIDERKSYRPVTGGLSPAVDIPSFYISDRVVLAGDCRKLGFDPPFGVDRDVPDSEPLTLIFDRAAGMLEVLGLRMPDEFELEFAANEALAAPSDGKHRLPVRFDLRPGEWTSSWAALQPGLDLPPLAKLGPTDPNVRVVRGVDASIQGRDSVLSRPFVPGERCELQRLEQNPNIAVRGVRSLRPRKNPGDFVRPVYSD